MLDECKVGFVGAGGVAMRHARHLTQLKDVRVVAVTDPNAAAAQSFAETTDAAVATDLDELIKTSPDAVYVCVPPHAHGAIEEQLLDAGIAMFVEKPLAMDLPTAERIADTASKAGVVTAVGHHWRYSPAVDLVRDLLAGRPVRLVGRIMDRPRAPGAVVEQAGTVGRSDRRAGGACTGPDSAVVRRRRRSRRLCQLRAAGHSGRRRRRCHRRDPEAAIRGGGKRRRRVLCGLEASGGP